MLVLFNGVWQGGGRPTLRTAMEESRNVTHNGKQRSTKRRIQQMQNRREDTKLVVQLTYLFKTAYALRAYTNRREDNGAHETRCPAHLSV